jgi:protocatechuate 3,4-dioxygenase beta subunit
MLAPDSPALQTYTDGDGHFTFEGLPGGHYVLEVAAAGFHPARGELDLPAGGIEDIRLVLEPLPPPFGEIWGTVKDAENGEPVVSALVFVHVPSEDAAIAVGGYAIISDRTDEQGRYELPDVPVGPYQVQARHKDYEPQSQPAEVHPGLISLCNFEMSPRPSADPGAIAGQVTDADTGEPIAGAVVQVDGIYTFAAVLTDANGEYTFGGVPPGDQVVRVWKEGYRPACQEVTVVSGETSQADFALEPFTPPPPGAIAGTVTDALTGAPILGARVWHWPLMNTAPIGSYTGFVDTDANGEYEIPGLKPGYYGLRVAAAGHYDQWRKTEVLSDQVAVEDFALAPVVDPGAIAGRVRDAETSAPIAGAVVYYHRREDCPNLAWQEWADQSLPHVTTNENGDYGIPNLQPGEYALLVRAEGYWPVGSKAVVVSGETTQADFALPPFVLPEPGTIVGRVTNAETSEPLAGAAVYYVPIRTVSPTGAEPGSSAPSLWPPHAWTDENGLYMIEDLPPGDYALTAYKDGFYPGRRISSVVSGETTEANFALRPYAPPQPGAIVGQATNARTGEPIAGAYIFYAPLTPEGGAPAWTDHLDPAVGGSFDPGALGVPYVRTNQEGRYEIPELRPGTYLLTALHLEYYPGARIAQVPEGATVAVDFALEPVGQSAPGAIAGRVTDAETGDPVQGAAIYYGPNLLCEGAPDWAMRSADQSIPHLLTDENGRYLIAPLRPAPYHLLVRAEGYEPAHKDVQVVSNVTTVADFALEPHVSPPPGAIQGKVLDAVTSQPIVGARIYYGALIGPDGTPEWWSATAGGSEPTSEPSNISFVVTDENGEYAIPSLPPLTYHLEVCADGYDPQHRRVEVESGQTSTANFALQPYVPPEPGGIQGTIVAGESGEAIAGARVYYFRLANARIETDERSPGFSYANTVPAVEYPFVETNENGYYLIEDLEPGCYALVVKAAGYLPQSQNVRVLSGQITTADFALSPLGSEVGAIFGKVIDARTAEPLADAHVWVVPYGAITIQNAIPQVVLGQAVTDENGEYEIADLPVGPVVVFAAREGYRAAHRWALVEADQSTQVDFALQPIPAPETGHLVGTVRDAQNEQPVPRAMVTLAPDDELAFALSRRLNLLSHTLTDDNGNYAFRDVPIGSYRVVVKKIGYLAAIQPVAVEAGQVSELNFLLQPCGPPLFGSLGGQVTNAVTGEPIGHAFVRLCAIRETDSGEADPDSESADLQATGLTATTDERGFYRFPRVLEGKYVVQAFMRGYEPARKEAEVIRGQHTVCDLALAPYLRFGAVEGIVTDAATGDPIENALVFVPHVNVPNAPDVEYLPHARTDEDGKYRIEQVPVGQRIVVAFHRDYYEDAQLANVEEGESTILDFALIAREGEPVTLRIQAENAETGEPVAGVRVHIPLSAWAHPAEWGPLAEVLRGSAVTDETGTALIEVVPISAAQENFCAVVSYHPGHPAVVPVPVDLSYSALAAFITPWPADVNTTLSLVIVTLGPDGSQEPNGGGERSYQWRKNGSGIPGATGPTLTPHNFGAGDTITCVVTRENPDGSSTPGERVETPPVRVLPFLPCLHQENPRWHEAASISETAFVKPGRPILTGKIGFEVSPGDDPGGRIVFGSWNLSEDGGAPVFPLAAGEAEMAEKLYSARLTLRNDAASADLCPGYRIEYTNEAFTHFGGIEVVTRDAANAPSEGADYIASVVWEVPFGTTDMGDDGTLANWPLAPGKDLRQYTLLFDLLHSQRGDHGVFTVEDVEIQPIPRPVNPEEATLYADLGLWNTATLGGSFLGAGSITKTPDSITLEAGPYDPLFQARFIGAFAPPATAAGELNGNPPCRNSKLARLSIRAASLNVETTPLTRVFLHAYMSQTETAAGGSEVQYSRNVVWFDIYGALEPYAKLHAAWGGRNLVDPNQVNPGVPPAGEGAVLSTWAHTHEGYDEENDYLLPAVQVLSLNRYAAGDSGWQDDSGGITFSDVKIEIY